MGSTPPELVKLTRRAPCSLCGSLKRYLINLPAIELGVDAVAFGHHADDILVFAIKNFLLQGITNLVKMVPVLKGIQGVLATKVELPYEV